MFLFNHQEKASPAAEKPSVFLTPAVPQDPSVNTWSRFITTFEASEFTGWIDESVSWKSTCYIGDWTPLLKIRVRGPEAQAFLEYLSTNYWPNFRQYQAKHAILCRDNGNIMGEGVVMMLGPNDFVFSSVPGVTWAVYQFHCGAKKFDAIVEDVSNDLYLFQVQGPKSVEVMEAATGGTVTDLKFMNSKEVSINGCQMLCLRQGVSGERGFELWGPISEAQTVYKAILAAGEKSGIRQLGIRAKPVNHVEGAFATPGLDFLPAVHGDDPMLKDYHQFLQKSGLVGASFLYLGANGSYGSDPSLHHSTPFDLGWDRLVNFDHDFIGKEALQAISKAPPNSLVTLEWNSEDVSDVYASLFREESFEYMEMPRGSGGSVTGSSVYVDGSIVGCAVSRCYSYWFKKMISLCLIERKHSAIGTEVMVKWGEDGGPQKMIRAVVTQTPYKEDQRKKAFKPRA